MVPFAVKFPISIEQILWACNPMPARLGFGCSSLEIYGKTAVRVLLRSVPIIIGIMLFLYDDHIFQGDPADADVAQGELQQRCALNAHGELIGII